ncbi:MAG: hypothetical protein RLZZ352_1911 [Pseudomonadota bacterium]|jgi:hypothetical protein
MQTVAVACIVSVALLYVLWSLMPARWRRALAAGLLASGWPLGAHLRRWLSRQNQSSAGCGCSGCDRAPGQKARASQPQVVQIVRPHKPR